MPAAGSVVPPVVAGRTVALSDQRRDDHEVSELLTGLLPVVRPKVEWFEPANSFDPLIRWDKRLS